MKRLVIAALAMLALSACTSSHILVGQQRPPISPEEVRIYLDPPAVYEKVAVLESNNNASFAFTSQQKTNKVIERLRAEAAALGANGILLQGVQDQYSGSVGMGNAWASGGYAWGTGVSTATFVKVGNGVAIYVPLDDQPQVTEEAHALPVARPTSVTTPSPVAMPAAQSRPYEPDPAKRCDACNHVQAP